MAACTLIGRARALLSSANPALVFLSPCVGDALIDATKER